MSRIRSARQARRLRPIAAERARAGKLVVGTTVFFGGICYGYVRLYSIHQGKPLRYGLFTARSGAFFGPLRAAYNTREEYEASGVHWKLSEKL